MDVSSAFTCTRAARCTRTEKVEVSANGNGIGDEGDDSHFAGTDRTDGDVDLEGTRFILHPPQ